MPAIRKAFTVVELLVVMAIIALLVTLVMASLHGLRSAANRTESLNAVRGLIMAYNTYSTDANGNLMPGFMDQDALNLLSINAKLRDGTRLTACAGDVCDASSYVWRLSPYMDYNWLPVVNDYRSKQAIARFEQEVNIDEVYGLGSANWPTELGVGAVPAFGLNSIHLGGDSYHGGAQAVNRNPWTGSSSERLAATKYTQVKNPAKMITFGTTRHYDDASTFAGAPVGEMTMGYCELRAPYLSLPSGSDGWVQQWYLEGDQVVALEAGDSYSDGGGVPVGRWGNKNFITGLLDGSAAVEDITVLGAPQGTVSKQAMQQIMSRWSPFVTAPVSE